MNIFYLDSNPKSCAEMHLDKHVVKMILEYAQLLSTAHRVIDGEEFWDKTANGRKIKRWRMYLDSMENNLYKATHINHPSAVWVRQSFANYNWLYVLWRELMSEYTYRYMKRHACEKLIPYLSKKPHRISNDNPFTEPPPAMPDYCKVNGDSVASYRNYYINEKASFASWTTQPMPDWFRNNNNANIQFLQQSNQRTV
jgi:hypothetical protein